MDDEVIAFTDAPSTKESKKLTILGRELYSVDKEIKTLEEKLEERKKRRLDITMKELPDYLTEIGQDWVGLPEFGVDVILDDYYHANIAADWPEEQREKAFVWLEENGHGDLIKTVITITFSRYQFQFAKTLVEKITKMKIKGLATMPDPVMSMAVPWNTLTAFVKEQTIKGVALPLETLGATVGRIVKLKQRK